MEVRETNKDSWDVCVCVRACVGAERVGVRVKETETWMGKPKLMLECVCWIGAAAYPEDNLAAAF